MEEHMCTYHPLTNMCGGGKYATPWGSITQTTGFKKNMSEKK